MRLDLPRSAGIVDECIDVAGWIFRSRIVRKTRLSCPTGSFTRACYAAAMQASLDPVSFLVVSVSRWVNQRQQHVIDYLVEENRVPRGAGYA